MLKNQAKWTLPFPLDFPINRILLKPQKHLDSQHKPSMLPYMAFGAPNF